MMKKMRMAVVMLLGLLMTGCSTSKIDGVAVGNVSNSECLQKGRTRGDSDRSWAPKLILTRDGDNIVGEIRNYEVNCGHRDLIVTCKQDGSELTITVKEEVPKEDGDISRTSCLCPVNIYFTIYDIEGDLFHVNLEGNDYGNVSFKEGNRVELTEIVHAETEVNVLLIQSDDGQSSKGEMYKSNEVYNPPHCYLGKEIRYNGGSPLTVYHMGFGANIKGSYVFDSLTFGFESDRPMNFSDLKAGDTFDSSQFDAHAAYTPTWTEAVMRVTKAISGNIAVVGTKKIEDDNYMVMRLIDLKFDAIDKSCVYTVNGIVEYKIWGNLNE